MDERRSDFILPIKFPICPKGLQGVMVSPMFAVQKPPIMKTILLLREIYYEGFKDIGHFLVRNYFKVFAWISFTLFFIVLYAFIYRIVTGFVFD